MASKKSDSAAADIAALQAELAALRKEVAALKSQLSKKSSGGADPRVDKLVQYWKDMGAGHKKDMENLGL